MRMRIPPRMPLKMKMMSRWTSCFFSFPFWHLMTKGEWKAICVLIWACVALVSLVSLCFELMLFYLCFELPWSFVRTMWCENLCNVCYSVLSCRTWVISKEFLLVCVKFELWIICFLFFCVLVQKGRILRATGRILRISWPESPDLYPESPGPADRYTFYWVDNMSYASHIFLALTYSPHCKTYKSFCVSLDKYANCWHVKSKLKFKVHGIHLGGALIC